LFVESIIFEPTAVAIAYGLDEKAKKNILVYDLGIRVDYWGSLK